MKAIHVPHTGNAEVLTPVELPFTPGGEACGVVTEIGADVTEFSVGDRITTASAAATYAEYFVVDEEFAVAVPEGISDEVAAALPLQGMTAHYLTRSTYQVQPEDTVLFHAGAGGVGGLAIQLLKSIGATVITTVSTEEKAEIARSLGADHVLGYDDFAEKTRDITDGRGVEVVYDSVGKTPLTTLSAPSRPVAWQCSLAAHPGRCPRSICNGSTPADRFSSPALPLHTTSSTVMNCSGA